MRWFIFCRIFGHVGEAAADILYVNWLNMVRAGLLGLEYFSPDSKKWRQVGVAMLWSGQWVWLATQPE